MAMSAWTAWRTTALPERRVAGTVSDAGPAAGRLASTRSMTRRFSICSRSAPVASLGAALEPRRQPAGHSRVSASAHVLRPDLFTVVEYWALRWHAPGDNFPPRRYGAPE